MYSLHLSFVRDRASNGELTAVVASDGFCGRGTAWFDRADLEDFIAALEQHPLDDDNLPALAGGFFAAGRLIDEHIGIRVLPHKVAGQLRVRVHVATIVHCGSGADLRQELTISFLTGYADVARFRISLAALIGGTEKEAVLEERS